MKSTRHLAGVFSMAACLWSAVLAGGCGQAIIRSPVPHEWADTAQIAGMPRVRFWGDRVDPDLQREWIEIGKANPVLDDPNSESGPGLGGLVLSGGGDCGAYGAGLLCGWNDRGTRPRFRIVTGVSTGALIAPFAFLGPKYDGLLRDAYTKVSAKDIMDLRPILDWLRFDSAADVGPLRRQTERQFPDALIDEVAREHAKGRRLLVQTVDLDAQRPVVWDLGAIASSKDPQAHKLFRQVVLASAAIPGVFPPQYIRVKANGRTYDEMHVDGGVASQMLMSTLPVDLESLRKQVGVTKHKPRVYVVRNGFYKPERKSVTPRLFPIAGRAVATLIKSQAFTETHLMYYQSKAAAVDFYLTYIPDDYTRTAESEFDTAEMNRMFQRGYESARNGDPWSRVPPRLIHPNDPPAAAAITR